MSAFLFRAATPGGELRSGAIEADSPADALNRLRQRGLMPIEARPAPDARPAAARRADSATRMGAANALAELGVLLGAGLPLDRALAVCIETMTRPALRTAFEAVHKRVNEGATLSAAMGESPQLFPPMASAMAEAGEANGRLDIALTRLAETLDRAETLRQTIVSAMVYPALLLCLALGVILLMALVIVPQFEGLFADQMDRLPATTRTVIGVSHALRVHGWLMLIGLAGAVVGVRQWLRQPAARRAFDRAILKAPLIGPFVVNAQTARFVRVLGSLVDGGVPLPTALTIARRSLSNVHMAEGVGRVAAGLKEGAGLSRPLAATGLFPPMALSFLRTGEETAQLGQMLNRLADILDRDVRTALQRLISILTPTITIVMGAVVCTVIASILSAILGFNDLALTP